MGEPFYAPAHWPLPTEALAFADRIERGEQSALSIRQPYPHHIFWDGKDCENRVWRSFISGWVLCHAGVSKEELGPGQEALPRGGMVGMIEITGCVDHLDSEWFFGPYAFTIGKRFPIDLVPCKGALGFFLPPVESRTQIAEAVRLAARTTLMGGASA